MHYLSLMLKKKEKVKMVKKKKRRNPQLRFVYYKTIKHTSLNSGFITKDWLFSSPYTETLLTGKLKVP